MTTIINVLINNGFSDFISFLQETDDQFSTSYINLLAGPGPFTVFAPTNTAFQTLLDANMFTEIPDLVTDLGSEGPARHIVSGNLSSVDLLALNGQQLEHIGGRCLDVTATNGILINASTVTITDVGADNGVIHVIDTVLTDDNPCPTTEPTTTSDVTTTIMFTTTEAPMTTRSPEQTTTVLELTTTDVPPQTTPSTTGLPTTTEASTDNEVRLTIRYWNLVLEGFC